MSIFTEKRKKQNYFKQRSFSLKIMFILGLTSLVISQLKAKNIPLISKEISIPRSASRSFGFGTVPQRNTTVLLEVTARINCKRLSGSTAFLTIFVNGNEVKVSKTRHAIRLVNKPLVSPVAQGALGSWFADSRAWRLIYAPDFKCALKQSFYKGDPYSLVLDITDLIDPAAENRIKLVNLVTNSSRWKGLKPDEGNMVVKSLNIQTKRGSSPMMLPAVNITPIINRGTASAGPAKYSGKILPGGGFVIKTSKQEWKFASSFSYPNAGFNHLLASAKTNSQTTWKTRVKHRPNGGEVSAQCPYYRLRRDIRFTPQKIEIKDTLTNLSKKPLGLLVRHEVNLKGLKTPTVRLAGNPDPAVNKYHSGMNPSVHISLPKQSIGILCEDDVFRNQVQLYCKPSNAGISTEMLRIGTGKTYTLAWSVYPVAGPDYFDFINLVRQDWKANFTLQGPYTLFNPKWILATPVDKLREYFTHQGIKYAISNGSWYTGKGRNRRNAFGTGALEAKWAEHRDKLRKAAARIRKAAPNVKIMTYFDSRRDSSKNSQKKFRDSWWTSANGKQLFTTWGIPGNYCYTMVPMLNNSFGKAMLSAIDRYIKKTDSDSIYWDEMGGGGGFGKIGITYNIFDGNSCLLDMKKYTIKREVGIPSLLINSFLITAIKHLQNQNKPLLGNCCPDTRSLLATGAQRMIESQHNDFWCYESNLSTPLGWAYTISSKFSGITKTLRMACLPVGVPLGAKHEISRYLFPFTPIELHHAYLLGKERIITLHDGNYGWSGEKCLVQIRHFDKHGQLVEDNSFTVIGKEARTKIKLANNEEAMILVRTPVSFKPADNSKAKVNKVYCSTGLVSFYLEAPEGGILKVKNGTFLLKDSDIIKLKINNILKQIKVVNGCSDVKIPRNFKGKIEISNNSLLENIEACNGIPKILKNKVKLTELDDQKVFTTTQAGSTTLFLKKIKVTPGKKYRLSVRFKKYMGNKAYAYTGIIPYTQNGRIIYAQNGEYKTKGSFTELTKSAKKGDKVVFLKNSSAWKTGKYYVAAFNAQKDYSDIPNFDIVSGCMKNENNKITLRRSLKKNYPAGTKVRQHRYGTTYIYLKYGKVPNIWQEWSGIAYQPMLRKAAFIRPMIIIKNEKNTKVVFDKIIVEEI
jgi:hypothetical protein